MTRREILWRFYVFPYGVSEVQPMLARAFNKEEIDESNRATRGGTTCRIFTPP